MGIFYIGQLSKLMPYRETAKSMIFATLFKIKFRYPKLSTVPFSGLFTNLSTPTSKFAKSNWVNYRRFRVGYRHNTVAPAIFKLRLTLISREQCTTSHDPSPHSIGVLRGFKRLKIILTSSSEQCIFKTDW